MTAIAQITVTMKGSSGGNAMNVLHFSPGTVGSWESGLADNVYQDVYDVYTALAPLMCPSMDIEVAPIITIIDPVSGQIQDVLSSGTVHSDIRTSGAAGHESRATALMMRFNTGEYRNGRVIKGRSFVGPASGHCIDENGKVGPAIRETAAKAYDAVVSGLGPRLCVYRRPGSKSSVTGAYADVDTVTCWDIPGSQRNRRF